jgi:hypothetical protein
MFALAPFIFPDLIYPLYDDKYFALVTSIFVLMISIMSWMLSKSTRNMEKSRILQYYIITCQMIHNTISQNMFSATMAISLEPIIQSKSVQPWSQFYGAKPLYKIRTKFLNPFSRFHDRHGADRRSGKHVSILPLGIFQVRKYLKWHKQVNMCKKEKQPSFTLGDPILLWTLILTLTFS